MSKEQSIDLDRKQLKLLEKIIDRYVPNKAVWVYGSRVTWKASQTSDLDLVAFDCAPMQILDLKDALEESDLLISVDVMDWERIPDNFKENIKKKYVVLQEKSELKNWQMVKIGGVANVVGGGTPSTKKSEYWGGEIPWLTPRDLSNFYGRYISKGERNISKLGLSKSSSKLVSKGAVLLTTRAPVGYLAIAENEISTNQGFRNLIPNKKTNNLFLFYLLKHNVEYLKSQSSGTTFGELAGSTLKSLSFLFPSLPEQKAIAEVLSSLDDKIDLLHRQNKTLEDMAQTLFRRWFVEEADERWDEVKLEKFVKCTTGHSYRSTELQPSNIALVTLKNFARDGSFRMDGYKEFIGKYKENQIVRQGDLVVSHTDITQEADIIGNPILVVHPEEYETLVMTMDLMKVESTEEQLSKEFLFYLFKSRHFKSHCLGCSNGTTVLHMSRKAIPSYQFKIPNREKIMTFTQIVKPDIEKMFGNIFSIKTLENLHVALLPKLMSGKVKV